MRRLRLFAPWLPLLLASACGPTDQEVKTPPPPAPAAAAAPAAPAPRPDSLATFSWQDEVCANTGTYPPGAYTARQLRDTYDLVNFPGVLTNTTVFNLQDYTAAHFEQAGRALELEHDSLARRLQQAEVVPTAFWRKVRQLRTWELEENYQLAKYALDGYYHPESLLHNPYSAPCRQYAEALASADTALVLRTWRQLIDEQKRHNGAPDLLEEQFRQESTAPDRLTYARIQLMTFGWYNCANDHRKYADLSDQYALRKNYHQLFKAVKSECEDVD